MLGLWLFSGYYFSTRVSEMEREATMINSRYMNAQELLSTVRAQVLLASVLVREDEIPVRDEVRGASELLGIDPMYVACEGRLVAVVPGADADRAVAALRAQPLGEQAAVIGRVRAEQPGIVQLKTAFGGTRIVDLLVGDPLPRIC